jgi:hypothetical protein
MLLGYSEYLYQIGLKITIEGQKVNDCLLLCGYICKQKEVVVVTNGSKTAAINGSRWYELVGILVSTLVCKM